MSLSLFFYVSVVYGSQHPRLCRLGGGREEGGRHVVKAGRRLQSAETAAGAVASRRLPARVTEAKAGKIRLSAGRAVVAAHRRRAAVAAKLKLGQIKSLAEEASVQLLHHRLIEQKRNQSDKSLNFSTPKPGAAAEAEAEAEAAAAAAAAAEADQQSDTPSVPHWPERFASDRQTPTPLRTKTKAPPHRAFCTRQTESCRDR